MKLKLSIHHLRALFLNLPLLATGLACGESDPPPLTREAFCERWATAACQPEVVSVCQAASNSACRAAQEAACLKQLPAVIQDENVDACIDAVGKAYADADLKASELDVVVRLGGPCSQILASRTGGATCVADSDCSSSAGQRCVFKDAKNGRCEVPEEAKAGFPCDEPQQTCEAGFFCNGDNCIAALGTGMDCVNNAQCGENAFCNGKCETSLSVGADCEDDFECGGGICYSVGESPTCTDRIRLSPAEPLCDDLR